MMSSAIRAANPSSLPTIALTFSWRKTVRSWQVRHVTGLIVSAVLSLVAIWYLGATIYLIFHDRLVASLVSHQIDIQYSYEDRIADLQTQLDRETSRGLLDRQTLASRIRLLSLKSEILDARAGAIDQIMRNLHDLSAVTPVQGGVPRAALSARGREADISSNGLASEPKTPSADRDPVDHEARKNISSSEQANRLIAALDRIEARQTQGVSVLQATVQQRLERFRSALVNAGIPPERWDRAPSSGAVGGPFVPLAGSTPALTFDQSLAFLRAALIEQAHLDRLVDTLPLRPPVEGPLQISSPFGVRIDPFLGQGAMHTGTDLVETYGASVEATAGGVVTIAGPQGGYGNMVEIDHGDGFATRYGHLSAIDVVVGAKVRPGSIIGRVGSTGRSTGPHLHYETRINGTPVDPSRFLRAGAGLFADGHSPG